MASCITSQWGDSYSPQVRLTVTQTSSTNTSVTLSWKLEYVAHGYAIYTSVSKDYSVKIGGSTVKSGSYAVNGVTSTKTIASGTKNITKTTSTQTISFSVSFTFGANWSGTYAGTKTASGTISVSAKPSYKISYNANGGTGAPSSQTKWYGTNLTLSRTKPTRTGYSFLGWSTSSTATSATWNAGGTYTANASDTLYAVWKANTYSVKYSANGGTGAPSSQTKTYGKTLTLSSTKPTRTNYNFKGWGTSSSSTTVSYSPGDSYTKNASITLYAIWSLAYTAPRISSFSVDRCDSSGVLSEEGTDALIKFNWRTDKSVTSIKIEWKQSSESTYSNNITVEASGTSGSVQKIIGDDLLNTEYLYNVRVTVSDSSGSSNSIKVVPQIAFTIDFLSGGKGVALGKPAELSDYLDLKFKTKFRNTIVVDQGISLYSTKPDTGETVNVLYFQNSNGNTVLGYGNYELKSGNTHIYGNDVRIYSARGGGSFIPYLAPGDSITMTLRTAGYITSSSTNLSFIIPISRPVLGSTSVSVSSVDGFILRQNAKYTHGSSASRSVTPDKYSASIEDGYITVMATFSDVSNAANNSSIGVYWSGKLTFS